MVEEEPHGGDAESNSEYNVACRNERSTDPKAIEIDQIIGKDDLGAAVGNARTGGTDPGPDCNDRSKHQGECEERVYLRQDE